MARKKPRSRTAKQADGRWLTREKLVLAVLVPIFIAVLSAALAWWPNRSTTEIEPVGLSIVPGSHGRGTLTPPKVQVAVRNIGDQVSVISGARITVLDSAHLPACEAGAVLTVSETYDVALPLHPAPDEELAVDLAQEIEPNRADRFEFSMQVPDTDPTRGTFLYLLDVTLVRDGGDESIPAGVAIVAAPLFNLPPLRAADLRIPGVVGDCYQDIRTEWERVLAWEGQRSPDLPTGNLFGS